MRRFLAVIYGLVVYFFFLATFVYAIFFVAGIVVPKTIDTGQVLPAWQAALIDGLLLSVFAIQHSVMARQGFKRVWTQIIPPRIERSTYVLAATLALALVMWQWRAIPNQIWDVRGTILSSALGALFWVGWVILLTSTFLINHFELFGLKQVWSHAQSQPLERPSLKTPALYKLVRHPLYLGFVIAFWSAPVMTAGHLLFSLATTGYILVGIFFEERDLVQAFGDRYLEYRRQVPMLIPIGRRAAEKRNAKTFVR
jgi:protein-S-isoprenylcysteine O-methyltransferase Ste14